MVRQHKAQIVDALRHVIDSTQIFKPGMKVLLAVSGGLDSVALAHLFVEVREHYGIKLHVIHVHHGLRGREADDDTAFVQSLGENLQLPVHCERVETRGYAEANQLSIEESARVLRYRCFEEQLKNCRGDLVALAHTENDQAETIMDRFLRGSGALGLGGMQVRRDRYFRPLLSVPRSALQAFVDSEGIQYREDSSNEDLRFKRNRIRHELLPYIEEHFNPRITETLNRSGLIFAETEEFLADYAKSAFKSLVSLQKTNEIVLEIAGFLSYFCVIKKYVLFHAFGCLNIERNSVNFAKLDGLLSIIEKGTIGKRARIDSPHELLIDHDGIVIREVGCVSYESRAISLRECHEINTHGRQFIWEIQKRDDQSVFNSARHRELFDLDKTGFELHIGTAKPGDRFVPLNLKGSKKVADFFSDNKVPLRLRNDIPILRTAEDIVWICGYCIDDRFKVTGATSRILRVEMRDDDYPD